MTVIAQQNWDSLTAPALSATGWTFGTGLLTQTTVGVASPPNALGLDTTLVGIAPFAGFSTAQSGNIQITHTVCFSGSGTAEQDATSIARATQPLVAANAGTNQWYELTLMRGTTAVIDGFYLRRFNAGAYTTIVSVLHTWPANVTLRATLICNDVLLPNNNLFVKIQRLDTLQWLTPDFTWVPDPTASTYCALAKDTTAALAASVGASYTGIRLYNEHASAGTPSSDDLLLETATAPSFTLAFGVFTSKTPWDGGTEIDSYTTAVGQRPTLTHWYENWTQEGSFYQPRFDACYTHGTTPLLSWDPTYNGNGTDGQPFTTTKLANGVYDTYLNAYATAAAAYGRVIVIRPMWEMNTNYTGWAPGLRNNGPFNPVNTIEGYILGWRHIVQIFRNHGASLVKWFFCPNSPVGPATAQQCYPGDAWVDYVGFDSYNFGPAAPYFFSWSDLLLCYTAIYAQLTSFTNKPIIVGETASNEVGGDKGAWITSGLLTQVPAAYPRLRVLTWYDNVWDQAVAPDHWSVNTSAGSLAAWQAAVQTPMWSNAYTAALAADPILAVPQPLTAPVTRTAAGFSPPTVVVQPGGSVTWRNADSVGRSVVLVDGSFSSGTIAASNWLAHTFPTPGTYRYYDGTNTAITGVVVVRAGAFYGS